MARHGVSIVKKCTFRGKDQEFANVYFYEGGTLDVTNANALIDAVKANEVQLHSSDVSFVRGLCWLAGGSPAANQMISQKALSGTGSQATNVNFDRERAYLIQWKCTQDIRGHTVYLRKWYHSCGNCAAQAIATGELQNTLELSSAKRTAIASAADAQTMITINSVGRFLCSETGRLPIAAATCHPWLEHHQLGDMWR